MVKRIGKQARLGGAAMATLGAVGSMLVLTDLSAAEGAGTSATDSPCELYFFPERPGAEISDGSPLPGEFRVSPGCEFFYFPGKDEAQLTSDPALREITGSGSHFRITPTGELLFLPSVPESAEQPATGILVRSQAAVPIAAQPKGGGQPSTLVPSSEGAELAQARQALESCRVQRQRETAQSSGEIQAWQQKLAQSQSRIVSLEAGLRQANANHQELAARLDAALAQLAATEGKATEEQTGTATQLAQLRTAVARLQQENAALAQWEGRYRECAAQTEVSVRQIEETQGQAAELRREVERLAIRDRELAAQAGDGDNDGIADAKDRCPNTPEDLATDAEGCASLELHGVEFATASHRLSAVSNAILKRMAGVLKSVSFSIEIQGHTDNVGTPEGNRVLSQRRAESVMTYLVEQGVPEERLRAKGYGDQRPVADNETAEGRALNRRVELARVRD